MQSNESQKRQPQQQPDPRIPDPAEQKKTDGDDDATSGSEGGGPRVGYSEPTEADRLKYPRPVSPRPKD